MASTGEAEKTYNLWELELCWLAREQAWINNSSETTKKFISSKINWVPGDEVADRMRSTDLI